MLLKKFPHMSGLERPQWQRTMLPVCNPPPTKDSGAWELI